MGTCHNNAGGCDLAADVRSLAPVELCANTRRPGTWIAFLTDDQLQVLGRAVAKALEVTQGKASEPTPCR